jgi:tellurite resistance protein TerC
MFDHAPIAYWVGFHVVVLILIVCDLAALNRPRRWTNLLFLLLLLGFAAVFGLMLDHAQGPQIGMEFASGYLIELTLSIDNLFIFLLMFRSFGLRAIEARKTLLYGVLGAIALRASAIFLGVALLERFAWIQFVFGALLLAGAARLFREKKETVGRTKWIQKLPRPGDSSRLKLLITAVVAVQIVDLVFALDSIPAVLAVTHNPFVAYSSNICAILGLRSLYFLLEDLLDRLRYLHYGLAVILAFVGGKMMAARWVHIPAALAFGVIVLVISIATIVSLLHSAGAAAPQETEE